MYGMMGMGMPEAPTVFELANADILPLLLAKVPEALLPKALEEDGEVSLLRKALAKRDLGLADLAALLSPAAPPEPEPELFLFQINSYPSPAHSGGSLGPRHARE